MVNKAKKRKRHRRIDMMPPRTEREYYKELFTLPIKPYPPRSKWEFYDPSKPLELSLYQLAHWVRKDEGRIRASRLLLQWRSEETKAILWELLSDPTVDNDLIKQLVIESIIKKNRLSVFYFGEEWTRLFFRRVITESPSMYARLRIAYSLLHLSFDKTDLDYFRALNQELAETGKSLPTHLRRHGYTFAHNVCYCCKTSWCELEDVHLVYQQSAVLYFKLQDDSMDLDGETAEKMWVARTFLGRR